MRARCTKAMVALAIAAGAGSMAVCATAQESATPPGVAALVPHDWAPEHAPAAQTRVVAAPVAGTPSPTSQKRDDATLDPEEAIKVPPAAPGHDPLDHAAAPTASPPAPVQTALSPLETAIKAALDTRASAELRGPQVGERRKERAAIAFFYASRSFAPVWSHDGKAVASVPPVLARLARAGEDGLTLAADPTGLKAEGAPGEVAESELALTEAVVAYARQATGSRVDPGSLSPLIGARPDLADPAQVLDAIAAAGDDAGDRLQALNPSDPRYAALRAKLVALRSTRSGADQLPIPSGPTLRVGMRDPRVPLIRSRFSLEAALDDAADLEYDDAIAEAVADFQRANGLPPSGTLTRRTVAALSGGEPSQLEGTLVANMEMWRWMPRDLGTNRIEVNIPEFAVTVFHDGEPVQRNRVVVGKPDTPTPIFSKVMKYVIVNPVWNVPESIIKKELLPKSGGDPRYIAAHGFDVSYRNGRLVVKQPSGEKNALGRIKFMFPNDYSVYLHDTPSKSLFAAARRAFSHGCVRVDQPFDFAEAVLNDSVPEGGDVIWSKRRLTSLLGDKERYVNLPQPLPIHIEYFTASIDADSGRLVQHEDIYGYARQVAAALGVEAAAPVVSERHPRRPTKTATAVDEDPR